MCKHKIVRIVTECHQDITVYFFCVCERKYSHFCVPYRKTQIGKQFINAPSADGSPYLAASPPSCLLCPLVLKDEAWVGVYVNQPCSCLYCILCSQTGLRLSRRLCRSQIYFQQTCNNIRRRAHRLNISSILLWKHAAGCFKVWQYFSMCMLKLDLLLIFLAVNRLNPTNIRLLPEKLCRPLLWYIGFFFLYFFKTIFKSIHIADA